MATTETLDRIARIVDELGPLSNVERGTPLRASDWNTLASAVLDLARMSFQRESGDREALARDFAPVAHEHVGQVDATWFDDATRASIQQPAGGDADLRAELRNLQSALAALRTDLAGVRAEFKRLQLSIDGVQDNDRAREDKFTRLDLRVESLRDVRDDVAKTQQRLDQVGGRVEEALKFRDKLVDPAGAPIDVGVLAGKIGALEQLRDNLKAADGTLVRYRDFESRLVAIEGSTITQAKLDASVLSHLSDASSAANAELSKNLLLKADALAADRFAVAATRLDGLQADFGSLRGRVDTQDQAVDSLRVRTGANETQVARIGAMSLQLDGLGTRLNASEARVNDHTTALAGLASAGTRFDSLDARVGRLEPLAGRVDGLDQSFTSLGVRVAGIDDLGLRVQAVEARGDQITTAMTRIVNLESAVTTNKTQLDGFTSRVSVIEAQSGDFVQRIGGLETSVLVSRRDLTLLQQDVGGVKLAVSGPGGIDSRLGLVERNPKLQALGGGVVFTGGTGVLRAGGGAVPP